jgi:general secretion pathway protein H
LGLPPVLWFSLSWLEFEVRVEVIGGRSIVLGPEPVIGAQSVMLRLGDRQIVIGTDGLGPFTVFNGETTPDLPEVANARP